MKLSQKRAIKINELIEQGKSIESIKIELSMSAEDWNRCCNIIYSEALNQAKKERSIDQIKEHVSTTSNNQIIKIIALNEKLADYALSIPISAINFDYNNILNLSESLPNTENKIIESIGNMVLNPQYRASQKKGRIEKFDYFKIFSKIIDAAILSYYRMNFISCYMTLMPVIEGVIIRWMGYTKTSAKPDFDKIRCFFQNSPQRQPRPSNILFHNIFTKVCDKILNNHFYKSTTIGNSWANFNRHVASHLLNDNQFGTKENCIRLFILLDTMTEIFMLESKSGDPRFHLREDEIKNDIILYRQAIVANILITPEQIILGGA